MANYVIELGSEETGEGGIKVWRSRGFYAGWTPEIGLSICETVGDAFAFPSKDRAMNVLQGDDRLKGSKIIETV